MVGRRITSNWDVVNTKDGWCVARSRGGKSEYVGADQFWARQPENVTPFATRDAAERARDWEAEEEAR